MDLGRLCSHVRQQVWVIVVHASDVNPATTLRESVTRISCVFNRLPSLFKEQTLLWIHYGRLARRNIEEVPIEALHIIQETSPETGPSRPQSKVRQVPVAAA